MDSIWEVLNWVIALRIQEPNKSATKKTRREDGVKGEATMPSSRYCSDYPRNLQVPLSFSWFISLAVGPCPWLFLIGLHKSSILHSRGGRVLSFQLSVDLALSYSVKPPQPRTLVGPVMKSTAIILIKDRGHGWQWKSIDNLKAGSSSFCHALTSQLLEWLEQGLASFMGEGCCFWNRTLRGFSGSCTAFQVSSPQEATTFLTLVWCIQEMMAVTLTAVGVARTTVWGPVQTGWSGSYFQSLTHTSSPGW